MMDCRHGTRARRGLGIVLTLGATVLLAGCMAGGQRRQEQALSGLQHALAGVYSSTAAAGGTPNGTPAADTAVTLSISPITAQLVGDAVFFVRETPADNEQLVLWQGIWTLAPQTGSAADHDKREPRIVQHSFLFKDPRRWADAVNDPDLLASALPQDLQALPGCDLIWRRTDDGYETADVSRSCRPGARAKGLWVILQARLQGSELSLTERPVGDNGALELSGAPLSMHLSRAGAP